VTRGSEGITCVSVQNQGLCFGFQVPAQVQIPNFGANMFVLGLIANAHFCSASRSQPSPMPCRHFNDKRISHPVLTRPLKVIQKPPPTAVAAMKKWAQTSHMGAGRSLSLSGVVSDPP
jgi:hypothetical protein